MNIWIIAPGEEASIWDECRKEGYIAIGWDKLNINNYTLLKDLRQDLINLYSGIDQNTKKHKFLWKFGKEIKQGDIVIARNGLHKIIGVGVITSKYIAPSDPSNPRKDKEEYKQIRKVNWLTTSEYTLDTEGQFARDTIVKTNLNDKRISKYVKGIIMQKEIEEKTKLLKYQKQIILQGPPGTGKTRLAKQMAIKMINDSLKIDTNEDVKKSLLDIGENQVKLIQFHPSYSYEDFVRGIVADSSSGSITYKTENKVLAQMAKEALANKDKPYILIIDEINRANLSSVLGELIYALEYRDEAVESMYKLKRSRKIILPSNLYIIGTMNTADRSIGHIDYAIRRRFTFVDVLSNENNILDSFPEGKKVYDEAIKLFTDEYVSPEFNIEDIKIGHSYFIAKNTEELKNKLEYQVKPLLREYIKDGILNESAKEKVEELKI